MPNTKLKWEFAETGGGDQIGINDPVISNFLGNVTTKLVREALQNSIDAGITKPVIVKFDHFLSKCSEIPGIDQLRGIYSACMDTEPDDKRIVELFKQLITCIQRNLNIPILKISDYNTRGLTPKDYDSLFRKVGAGSKETGKGGSFGLGKGAYFGASLFRMVFVSSKYEDKYNFAGKTRLVSFKSGGKLMQSAGTFGKQMQEPVAEADEIPINFRRNESGTDFYIYGFQGDNDWKSEIFRAVLENFWYAILQNNLIVQVGDIIMNQDSLDELIKKYYLEGKNKADITNSPLPFIKSIIDQKTKLIEEDLPTLGRVRMYILKNEEYPKQVAYIRNTGMVIQTKKHNTPYDYAGVFICENLEGNEILRKMENPEHDKWSSDIAISSGKLDKRTADNAAKELKEFIIDSLKSLQDQEQGEELHIKGLDKYLWLPAPMDEALISGGASAGDDKPSNKESAPEISVIDKKNLDIISKKEKLEIRTSPIKGRPGGTEDVIIPGNNNGGVGKKKTKATPDEDSEVTIIPIVDFKYRTYAVKDDSGEYVHTLILKSSKSIKIDELAVHVGTDNSLDDVNIWTALDKKGDKKYETDRNVIKNIELDESGEKKLKIIFEDGNKYSLNVIAYEHK